MSANFLDNSEDTLNLDGELDAVFKKYNVPKQLQAALAYAAHEVDTALHEQLDRVYIYGGQTIAEVLTGPQAARLISELLVVIHPLPIKPSDIAGVAVKGNSQVN